MTSIALERPVRGVRSARNRRLGTLTRTAAVTAFAGILCFLFILPAIYMVSTAFTDKNTALIDGAPPWPAVPKQYAYTDPQTGQEQTLDLFDVPAWDGVEGHVRELALLQKNLPPIKSVFIDPTTGQQVEWAGNPYTLSYIWQFHISLDNFTQAWDQMGGGGTAGGGFLLLFRNTLVIAILGTIGAVASAVLVAYGFARFRIPGKNALFIVMISTIIIPFQVTLIPTYIIFQAIGWTGTWLPLIVPHYFANAYNVFLLRQYFMTLPRELDEAAMIDGASPFRVLVSVIVPQAWPVIIAVTLFHFFFAWNDFLNPLIYLTSHAELWPIAVGLNNFNTVFRNAGTPAVIQAGAVMAIVLPVAIFFVAQRAFMRGVVISGVEK